MSRITAIDPAQTEGKTRDILDAVNKQLGVTPNLFRVAARAPAALDGLVGLQAAVARGKLRNPVRAAMALTVAEANGCNYCLSAHTVLGKGAGLSEAEMIQARHAASSEPRTDALLKFARAVVTERGRVGEAALADVRRAGVSDGELLETIANVVVNIFTNYINIIADTEIDFPLVRAGDSR